MRSVTFAMPKGWRLIAAIALAIIPIAVIIVLIVMLTFTASPGLLIVIIPDMDQGTLPVLNQVHNHTVFLNTYKLGYIKDDHRNLYKFSQSKTSQMKYPVNYIQNALDQNKDVIFATQDHYKGDMARNFLSESGEIEHLPEIIPHGLIASGYESLKGDTVAYAENESIFKRCVYLLLNLLDVDAFTFSAIVRSSEFPFIADIPNIRRVYTKLLEHLTRLKFQIFENKGITVLDLSNARKALSNWDAISYIKEVNALLKFVSQIGRVHKKNVLLLPVAVDKKIEIGPHFDSEGVNDMRASLQTLMAQFENIKTFERCKTLEKYFKTGIPTCDDNMTWSFKYLHDLVYDTFGIRLRERDMNGLESMSIYGTHNDFRKLIPLVATNYKDLGQKVSDMFGFTVEKHVEKKQTSFKPKFKKSLSSQCNMGENEIMGDIDFGLEEFVSMRCYNRSHDLVVMDLYKFSSPPDRKIDISSCETLELLDRDRLLLDEVSVSAITLSPEERYVFGQYVEPVPFNTCKQGLDGDRPDITFKSYVNGFYVGKEFPVESFQSSDVTLHLIDEKKPCEIIQVFNFKTIPVDTFELKRNVFLASNIDYFSLSWTDNLVIKPSKFASIKQDRYQLRVDLRVVPINDDPSFDTEAELAIFNDLGKVHITLENINMRHVPGHYKLAYLDFCFDFYIVESCPFGYIVVEGDTIESLSSKFKLSPRAITDENGGITRVIVGQTLNIPC